MSIRVFTKVLARRFGSPTLKAVAIKLADCASDDGRNIYPSVKRIADEMELSERTVQRSLRQLCDMRVIFIAKGGGRGPKDTADYTFDLAALEALPVSHEKGDTESPIKAKGDTDDALRVTQCQNKGDSVAPEPSLDPSLEPSYMQNRCQNDDLFGDIESLPSNDSCSQPKPSSLPSSTKNKKESSAAADAERVRQVWNAMASRHGLATIRVLSDARKRKLAARLKEAGGVEPLCQLIEGMAHSDFLMGNSNVDWKADFDFVLRPERFGKLCDGGYGNTPLGTPANDSGVTGETKEQMVARQKAMREQALADGTIY